MVAQFARYYASTLFLARLLLLLVCARGDRGKQLDVFINTTNIIAVTSPSFIGVNIDAASLYQETRLDVNDARFREIVCRFGEIGKFPMTLRIGGSSADDLSTFTNNSRHGEIYLTREYWDDIINFVDTCGFNLAWDLNMRIVRHDNASKAWDAEDARALLNHIRAKQQRIWAFQLGNEPGHFQTRNGGFPTARQHGADFIALGKLLAEYYPSSITEKGSTQKKTPTPPNARPRCMFWTWYSNKSLCGY